VTPDVLICAGLDPSGGAGLLADARVVSALGGRPVGVVTALTVQNTTAVLASEPTTPDLVREQLEFLLSDVEVRAAKIGMLGSTEVARALGQALNLTTAPVVWDPILAPSRGEVTFVDGVFADAIRALAPHVALITPNTVELGYLTGAPVDALDAAIAAGQALASQLGCAVLVKGGHLTGAEAIDALCTPTTVERLAGPRLAAGEHVHGTGCALSSAIATHLALGAPLVDACRLAKAFVAEKIASPARPGRGAAAIV
jgi:hydroxymethylpyrimidine kinase/phosphomethylpyrimidine kinase